MRSLVVVIGQVCSDCFSELMNGLRGPIQTLFLNGSVESFDVRLVVALPHAAVSVIQP
jgi:hypothetical protein